MSLSPAQKRLLDELASSQNAFERFDGRSRRTLEVLERLGLVEVRWNMHSLSDGNGTRLEWDIKARTRAERS